MNKLGRLRVSSAIGYLAAARVRRNLEIRANSFVRRLLLKAGRCHGVEVEKADGTLDVVEGRVYLLCAGAIMSPAILMRSGVGPRAQLEALGIDVHRDVPGVGQNLSDHPALAMTCLVRDPSLIDTDQPLIQTILRYTAPGSDKRNDLQIELLSFSGRRQGEAAFSIAAVLEYEYGRGELRLQSADPHTQPLIEQHFCEDERDISRLVACFKDTLAFAAETPLADIIERVAFPNPDLPLDDEAITRLCQRFAASGYHPCGTVKMGPASDGMAVVDQYGACHGVERLVVADASIMPSVPRANTNLTSIMIGEMVGEWLRTQPARYGL
jgi:choline dehydrogenase